ncbi:MAG: HlyC/CorC family transporter [Candidatus Cloacimonetes bacterium HGW-Cloacimonetes-1]|nr:MAG: HlyC/CorC family transporter [Candidatus Cloacimonetes bacterium HGW-Cloacimonetes-1]
MDDSKTFTIIVLFVLSAFFSGSETAFFSLSRIYLKKIGNTKNSSSRRILKLLRKPRQLLITLLLGNTFVNIAISSLAALWTIEASAVYKSMSLTQLMIIQIVVTTSLLLIFGEVIPKLLAIAKATTFAHFASLPLLILQYVLYPFVIVFEKFGDLISKKQAVDRHLGADFTTDEFQSLIHSDSSGHTLEEHEKRMLVGLFRFKDAEVSEIFVPRVKITAVEETQSLDELKELIVASGYSRIPVFKETVDDIIGIIYVKDLLLYPEKTTIEEFLRPVWFVTQNMKIETLLNQFKSKKLQVAVVVDEYGGTAGIITLEDILEEIVGEIRDEYDHDEIPELIQKDELTYIVSGIYNIRQFNHEFETDIDPDVFDNVAEFLLESLNHVPAINESLVIEDKLRLTILDSDEKSIKQIRVDILNSGVHEG